MQISNFYPKTGLWEWGNFGSQKVRSVLNRAIFNRFASNLGCAHYLVVSPPWKQEIKFGANLCPKYFFYPKIFSLIFLVLIFFKNLYYTENPYPRDGVLTGCWCAIHRWKKNRVPICCNFATHVDFDRKLL